MEPQRLISRHALLRTLAIALAICGLTVQAAMAADATVLKLSSVSGPPGTVTKLTGSGFEPGETLQLQFEATSASVAVADGGGAFHASLAIPTSATPRLHAIAAVGPAGAPSAVAPFTVTSAWAQGGADARRLGDNPFENYLTAATVASLDRAWTGDGTHISRGGAAVTSTMAVVGDDSGRLAAFPTRCGVADAACPPRWTAMAGGAISGTPAISGNTVYAGADDGKLYAFNLTCAKGAVCKPLWTGLTTTGASVGAPAVSGTTVFVPSADGKLYAFPTKCTGSCAPLWTADLGYKAIGVAVSNNRVFVRTFKGVAAYGVAGCGAASCSPIWTGSALGVSGAATPAVSNGVVYVAGGDTVYGFPINCGTGGATCSPTQSMQVAWAGLAGIAIADGKLFVADQSGDLEAFSASCASSCSPLWHATIGDGHFQTTVPPIVAADVVYLSTPQGLGAYRTSCRTDAATCAPLWTTPPGDHYYGTTESDGTLYTAIQNSDGGHGLVALTPNGQGIPG